MADVEKREELDYISHDKTFDELLNSKMERKIMSREEALEDILLTATKTNEKVNKELLVG